MDSTDWGQFNVKVKRIHPPTHVRTHIHAHNHRQWAEWCLYNNFNETPLLFSSQHLRLWGITLQLCVSFVWDHRLSMERSVKAKKKTKKNCTMGGVPVWGGGVAHLSCPAVSQSWRWTLKVFPVVVPLDAVYTWGERSQSGKTAQFNSIAN